MTTANATHAAAQFDTQSDAQASTFAAASEAITDHTRTVGQRLGLVPTPELQQLLTSGLVCTVASWKGGVGKTEIAKEVAYVLGGVLLDLDWDEGNASVAWGYRHERHVTAPLLQAIEKKRTPRVLSGKNKPYLVPCHPDLSVMQPERDEMADQITDWATEWQRPVIVDTHPGGGQDVTYGAIQASDVVLAVMNFENRSLEALNGMLRELADRPLMIVPTQMTTSVPGNYVRKLKEMSEEYDIEIGPGVHSYPWLGKRTLNMAISAGTPAKRAEKFVMEIEAIARMVLEYTADMRDITLTDDPDHYLS